MKKLRLIPTLLISTLFVSATTAGVVKLALSYNENQPNAVVNPFVTLYATDGNFYLSDSLAVKQVNRIVKYGTTWEKFSKNMPTPTNPGFDIMGWQYTYDETKSIDDEGWIDINPTSFVFDQDVRIKVKEWAGAEASNFATDSWATLLSVADDGLQALKDTYHPLHDTFIIQNINDEDEVNAKTRTVELKGLGNYRVRVIGENHDRIIDDEHQLTNKAATLTFEFVDVVEPSLGYSKDNQSDSWEKSYVREYLNTTLFSRLPSPLSDPGVIKRVSKTTLDTVNNERKLTNTEDRMFLPSLSELGYDVAPDGSNPNESAFDNEEIVKNEIVSDEGDAYSFYQRNYLRNDARLRYYTDYYGNTETVSYWTRSPFKNEVRIVESKRMLGVHSVYKNGYLCTGVNVDRVFTDTAVNAVAPCFCIGGNDDIHEIEVDASIDDTILVATNQYISNNSDCYINLYDSRDLTAPTFPMLSEESGLDYFTVKIGETVVPSVDEDGHSNYKFDRETGVLTLDINDKYQINDKVHVTLNYPQISGNFYDDSWANFIAAANNGYDALVSKYSDEYKANGNTFVGLKRKLESESYLDDSGTRYDYYVRVIGENHDTLENGKTTPLTFCFTQGFGKTIKPFTHHGFDSDYQLMNMSMFYARNSLPKYSESGFHKLLNIGIDEPPFIIIPKMYDLFEEDLANGLQTVNKFTAERQDDYSCQMVSTPSKLFILSYEELTGESDLAPLPGEGNQYAFYANSSSDATRKAFLPFVNDPDDTYKNNNFSSYATRTLAREDGECHIVINGVNGAIAYNSINMASSVLPAFAIGVNP